MKSAVKSLTEEERVGIWVSRETKDRLKVKGIQLGYKNLHSFLGEISKKSNSELRSFLTPIA